MPELGSRMPTANVGLAAALAAVVMGGGALLLGPASGMLDRAEAELQRQRDQLDGWTRERSTFRAPSEIERQAWRTRWEELERRIQPVADDSALVARVAQQLHAPSIRRLEVEPRTAPAAGGQPPGETITLQSVTGRDKLAFEPVSLKVSFRSSYADAVQILSRFERAQLPARIESLDIKRDRPGVWLRMDLLYFVRASGETS